MLFFCFYSTSHCSLVCCTKETPNPCRNNPGFGHQPSSPRFGRWAEPRFESYSAHCWLSIDSSPRPGIWCRVFWDCPGLSWTGSSRLGRWARRFWTTELWAWARRKRCILARRPIWALRLSWSGVWWIEAGLGLLVCCFFRRIPLCRCSNRMSQSFSRRRLTRRRCSRRVVF